jgi:hypothetical protein
LYRNKDDAIPDVIQYLTSPRVKSNKGKRDERDEKMLQCDTNFLSSSFCGGNKWPTSQQPNLSPFTTGASAWEYGETGD